MKEVSMDSIPKICRFGLKSEYIFKFLDFSFRRSNRSQLDSLDTVHTDKMIFRELVYIRVSLSLSGNRPQAKDQKSVFSCLNK